MLNSLDDTLGFQPPPPLYSEIVNISKCAQRMISKFFALKLYISWGPRTPKKLEDLLQQGWRLYKSTVCCCQKLSHASYRRHHPSSASGCKFGSLPVSPWPTAPSTDVGYPPDRFANKVTCKCL